MSVALLWWAGPVVPSTDTRTNSCHHWGKPFLFASTGGVMWTKTLEWKAFHSFTRGARQKTIMCNASSPYWPGKACNKVWSFRLSRARQWYWEMTIHICVCARMCVCAHHSQQPPLLALCPSTEHFSGMCKFYELPDRPSSMSKCHFKTD